MESRKVLDLMLLNVIKLVDNVYGEDKAARFKEFIGAEFGPNLFDRMLLSKLASDTKGPSVIHILEIPSVELDVAWSNIRVIKAIRSISNAGLPDAKDAVEDALRGIGTEMVLRKDLEPVIFEEAIAILDNCKVKYHIVLSADYHRDPSPYYGSAVLRKYKVEDAEAKLADLKLQDL